MKYLVLILPVLTILIGLGVVSCGSHAPSNIPEGSYNVKREDSSSDVALWLKSTSRISWLPRQVSGRYDGASALDNIAQAAAGNSVKRSSYGTAPGGYVRLDSRMLRAMQSMAKEGYTFRVTSMAGASHSRTSRHYAGLAFDVDMINGRKVGFSNPYWRKFLARCRAMGATETLGPGDKGHSTHIHAAWPR